MEVGLMNKIRLHKVQYNSQISAFEARVDVSYGERTFRYPCQVSGPKTMAMDDVSDALTKKALRMSDTGAELLSSL